MFNIECSMLNTEPMDCALNIEHSILDIEQSLGFHRATVSRPYVMDIIKNPYKPSISVLRGFVF